MQRRKIYSPETVRAALEMVRLGSTVARAAEDLKIPEGTIASWIRRSARGSTGSTAGLRRKRGPLA